MRRHLLLAVTAAGGLLASTQAAEANSCNLYQSQRWGQFREGCAMTVFSLPEVAADLPTVTRGGQTITPTVVQDEILLKVTFEHYPSEDSCELIPSYENRTFNRYVLTWPDLQGGDEILVDNYPYPMVVPGPGDCGVVDPFFYCQDGIHFCGDPTPPGTDPAPEDDSDLGGCSAGSHSPGWLAILGLVALVSYSRRSRASSRR